MRPRPVLGVDPGGRWTGVVLRQGEELRWHCLVTRSGGGDLPGKDYLDEVNDAVADGWAIGLRGGPSCGEYPGAEGEPLIAAELVSGPTGFRRGRAEPINLVGLLGTAMVLGAVMERHSPLLVAPGGWGSGPLLAYPDAIVGPREQRGTGKYKHLRSAWDIAGAGAVILRESAAGHPA